METYVDSFLEGCVDPEKQLAVMIGFSTLTNQGYPVVPSFWKVVKHLQPAVLLKYVDWLKRMFLRPDVDCCLDFTTSRQKQNQEKVNMWVYLQYNSLLFLRSVLYASSHFYLCSVSLGELWAIYNSWLLLALVGVPWEQLVFSLPFIRMVHP